MRRSCQPNSSKFLGRPRSVHVEVNVGTQNVQGKMESIDISSKERTNAGAFWFSLARPGDYCRRQPCRMAWQHPHHTKQYRRLRHDYNKEIPQSCRSIKTPGGQGIMFCKYSYSSRLFFFLSILSEIVVKHGHSHGSWSRNTLGTISSAASIID